MSGRGSDFFVSHAGRDTAWAEWLAWQLQQAGYTVELDVWDWAPGEDFVTRMAAALERADRLLAVCTEAYFASEFAGVELRAAFAQSAAARGQIVPVLVEPVILPSLFATLIHLDLTGLDEATAAARLRDRLAGVRPTGPPPFPHRDAAPAGHPGPEGRPAFAGALPVVWKVPPRNPRFTGRDGMLAELRRRLRGGEDPLALQALYGLGGVGKTQLALEYAHRFAADYDLVWWIDAEQPVLVPDQLAALAARLDVPAGPTVADTVDRLLVELRDRDRWLLVFDNAERPADIADYRPGGAGHLLITSRYPGWGALGGRLEVDVLTRAETIALLRARIPVLGEELADELAAELGDLPLAAAQAAGYLEQTDLPPGDYLRRFRARRAGLLSRGDVVGYSGRLDTAWALSLERLRCEDPAAVQLLELAAFLAPEPIPLALFGDHADLLTEPLRSIAADPDVLADTVGALIGYSLARRSPDGLQIHRLVQAVIRHQLLPDRQQASADQVVALLAAAVPRNPENPTGWSAYARLAPHVLVTAPLAEHSSAGRHLILDTISYLQALGDFHGSRVVGEQLLDRWRSVLGSDHPDTLLLAVRLTFALLLAEEPAAVLHRAFAEDTVQRCRRVLGPDDPTTLWAAATLVLALSLIGVAEAESARAVGEETLRRCRRVLGPDHPTTLRTATAVTIALGGLRQAQAARTVGEDTLQRCRRVLGANDGTCLWTATALIHALVQLGEAEPARTLGEDTLQRCRRVYGLDHPITLGATAGLVYALVQVGEAEPARALGDDALQRCHRVFGRDHSVTLTAAAALTGALVQVGDAERARALGADTLERCRRTFGPDHPITVKLTEAQTVGCPMPGSDGGDDRPSRSP